MTLWFWFTVITLRLLLIWSSPYAFPSFNRWGSPGWSLPPSLDRTLPLLVHFRPQAAAANSFLICQKGFQCEDIQEQYRWADSMQCLLLGRPLREWQGSLAASASCLSLSISFTDAVIHLTASRMLTAWLESLFDWVMIDRGIHFL